MFLQASVSATPETLEGVIRVGLQSVSGRGGVIVRFTGPVEVVDLDEGKISPDLRTDSLAFHSNGGKVECPSLKSRSALGYRLTLGSENTFTLGKRTYRGTLEILKVGNNLRVINEADLEDYVYGALLVEGSPSMQPESLKALAVAVRTYGVKSRNKHEKGLFDVCDTTHCQGYVGVSASPAPWAKTAQADTAGQILTWNDSPIWAAYSTDCGGATANNEDGGFGETPLPYLRAAFDTDGIRHDYCALGSSHRWVKEIPVRRLEAALNAKKSTQIGRLNGISIASADPFGRALTLRFESVSPLAKTAVISDDPARTFSTASYLQTVTNSPSPTSAKPLPRMTKTLKATGLRSLLGESVLKSTYFSVKKLGDVVRFEGKGYGHGVGMCLAGANGMAKAGIHYRDILGRYYNGASIVQLYETLPPDVQAVE